ncbi:hypothetical protein [Plesiomonas shigelloides]|uniref:hypothetical protein n=1 Tax=Plesiomonas shigelloides TaxID=703 RepID=UPI00387F14E8
MGFFDVVAKVADKAAEMASDAYYDVDSDVFVMSDRELALIATGKKNAGAVKKALVLKELFNRGYRSPEDVRSLL